jgi:hypothetical protein
MKGAEEKIYGKGLQKRKEIGWRVCGGGGGGGGGTGVETV